MPQLAKTFDKDLTIDLAPHPGLGAKRRLKLAMLVVRKAARSIEVAWDLEVLDNNSQPITRLTERLTQSATDSDIVILENNAVKELISVETFNNRYLNGPEILDNAGNPTGEFEPPLHPMPALWATEYDFWWLTACGNNPPPMNALLLEAGMRFAERLGLL